MGYIISPNESYKKVSCVLLDPQYEYDLSSRENQEFYRGRSVNQK